MDEPVNGKRERIRDLLAQIAHLEKKVDEAEKKCLTLRSTQRKQTKCNTSD